MASFRLASTPIFFGGIYFRPAKIVAVEDPSDMGHLGAWLPRSPERVALGQDLWRDVEKEGLDPQHPSVANLTLDATAYGDRTLIPNDWILVSEELMNRLPRASVNPSFLIISQSLDANVLATKRYTVVPAAGSLAFLRGGVEGASSTLLGIVGATVLATLLLASSLLGLEVRHRARDLRLIASLGGSRSLVAGLVLGQGLFLTFFGSVLGMAVGLAAVRGLVSAAPYLGMTNVLQPRLTAGAAILSLGAVAASGLVGTLIVLLGTRRRLFAGVAT